MEFILSGLVPYREMRAVQEALVQERIDGKRGDTIIFCEHPPVVTLGKRTAEGDIDVHAGVWKSKGIPLIVTDRGGSATFHGPGQLIVYPVIKLQERGLGVRTFVSIVLSSIAEELRTIGLPCTPELSPAGVWIMGEKGKKKVGSVGLRIIHGVTCHGFSVNVCNDLEIFRLFKPCGLDHVEMTSISSELRSSNLQPLDIALGLKNRLDCREG